MNQEQLYEHLMPFIRKIIASEQRIRGVVGCDNKTLALIKVVTEKYSSIDPSKKEGVLFLLLDFFLFIFPTVTVHRKIFFEKVYKPIRDFIVASKQIEYYRSVVLFLDNFYYLSLVGGKSILRREDVIDANSKLHLFAYKWGKCSCASQPTLGKRKREYDDAAVAEGVRSAFYKVTPVTQAAQQLLKLKK